MPDAQPEGEHDPHLQPAWPGASIPTFDENAWKKKLQDKRDKPPDDPGPQLPLPQRVEKFITDWKIDADIARRLRKEDPHIQDQVTKTSLWYANNPSYVLQGRINKLKGQTPVKQKLCRDWEMCGICEFGDKCMFSHDVERIKNLQAERAKSQRNQQVSGAVQAIESSILGAPPTIQAPPYNRDLVAFTPNMGTARSVAQAILEEDPSWLPHGARMQPQQEIPREPEPAPIEIVLPWKKLAPEEIYIVTEEDYASILARDATITQAATMQTNVPVASYASWPSNLDELAKRQKIGH